MPNVTSVWDFSPGETLTAAKLDDVNCGIHVFSGTATRDAAYGGSGERTLAEGEFAYLADSNTTQYYDGAAWQTLGGKFSQIVTVTKTDAFSTSSTSFVDVTGLSLSITPTSASSTILVLFNISMSGSTTNDKYANLVRGSTAIAQSTGATNNSTFYGLTSSNGILNSWASTYVDSPATTSATTYKFQVRAGSDTMYVNRRGADTSIGSISTITAIEVLP